MHHRSATAAPDVPAAAHRSRVLVVGGDHRVRAALGEILSTGDRWDVTTADGVPSAATGRAPEVALVDLTSPSRDAALVLVARLSTAGTSVVALSARESDRGAALASGAAAFVTKTGPDAVLAVVHDLTDAAHPPPRP